MTDPAHATSVLIAAYNAEATLDRAVASALAQPETAEVCVVDDASQDATAALAQRWAAQDGRVRAIACPSNQGPAAARNLAIDATQAPWITILDADDFMLPARLSELHRHAGEADIVADALIRVVNAEAPIKPHDAPFAPAPLNFEDFVLGNLGQVRGPLDLGFLKPVLRRAFIDRHDLRYRTDMRLGEDYEMYARALLVGARFLLGGATGYISVEREGSLSKRHGARELRALRDCDNELTRGRPLNDGERRALRRHWHSVDCRLQWAALVDAVKARDLAAAAATFHTLQSTRFLCARLLEQVWLRSRAALRRTSGRQASV